MPEVTIPIKQAGDTAANLASSNPTAYDKQLVLETDTLKFKVGDGVTAYNDLGYFNNAPDELTADELAAIQGAAAPSGANVFATMADVASGLSIGDAISGAANNQLLITDGSGNLSEIPNIIDSSGGGTLFLSDDGTYKAVGGGDALTSNPLSQFASTTSLQLLGVMSDETGTGSLVFGTSPTLVTPNLGTPSTLIGTNITGTAAGLTVGATTGVEPGADVTDTANVTAAGAAMLTGADFTGDITTTGSVTAVDFIGNLNGAVQFTGINRSGVTINKGEAIYISGISGNTPEVGLADADNASSMPAFGLAAETAIDNASLEIITFGSLTGIKTDYSGWALGDTLYVSTTPGLLTDTPPTGESSLIQNIGTVERLHSSNGSIKVGGAGRTNATPNLDAGKIFYGNGSNQSTSVALNTLADLTDATNIAAAGGVIPTGTPDGSKFLRDDQVWTAIPAGGDALTSNPLSQFASTTSLQLLGVMSDETGTGSLVFGTSPTLVTPDLGTPSALVGTNITGTAAGLTVGATTGVEAGADVTDTANVTAAGALMDSEVTNLAQVKAFDSADYATAAQGTTADNALPTTGGAMTGAITTTSTFDGRDVAADGTKLDGIESGADVTDTTNVTAAGALMDSELTSIADVKALDQSVVSGAAPVFDATNFTNLPSATPSGSDTQIQFNDSGAFGASAGATYSNGLTLTAQATTHKPLILSLANSQTANAFEINSFGGSSGDLVNIDKNGNTSVGGPLFKVSAGANPITLGYGIGGTTYGGLWLGTGTPSSSNYSFLAGVGQTFFNAEGSGIGDLEFRVVNATKFSVGVNGVSVFGGTNIAPTIPLSVNNSAGTSRLFSILDGGNVGIGTTTPTAQLHTTVGLATTVGQKIGLANSQSANAFEINSFGASGGNLLGVNGGGYTGLNVAPSTGARLDIIQAWSSATAALRFGSTTSNATTKLGRITCRHYTNAQKDVILFFGDVNATRNIMKFGGGSSYGNAATNIVFMTGANTTAGAGNLTMEVTDGKVGINTATTGTDYDSATAALDIDADLFRLRQSKTPSSASDTGNQGDICWDSSYVYVCTATNTWKRSAIATW